MAVWLIGEIRRQSSSQTSFPDPVLLLGSGELGKEVAIAAQRLGCRVIACDRADAPAMQVADVAEVLPMTEASDLLAVVRKHRPDVVIPEIEALAVSALAELEQDGITVIPTARATAVTMNRDRIATLPPRNWDCARRGFAYAASAEELHAVAPTAGLAGGGQAGDELVRQRPECRPQNPDELDQAWTTAMARARGTSPRVIVENFYGSTWRSLC